MKKILPFVFLGLMGCTNPDGSYNPVATGVLGAGAGAAIALGIGAATTPRPPPAYYYSIPPGYYGRPNPPPVPYYYYRQNIAPNYYRGYRRY